MSEVGLYDAIVIGGSYAGLSAAMSLGRSLRQVLVIDSGNPCNKQTPYSHNFITQDGNKPYKIAAIAKTQVSRYPTIQFQEGLVVNIIKTEADFNVEIQSGDTFHARKLIFATGLKDVLPEIEGFSDCWGISILHCPYCHGYEVKNKKMGIIGNGNWGFELTKMLTHWTKNITLFTNGQSALSAEQNKKLKKYNIEIIEATIEYIAHKKGQIQYIALSDGSKHHLNVMYAKPSFQQQCTLPIALGCEMTEQGIIKVDSFQRTSVKGVFACGDNSASGRAVSIAVSTGSVAGINVNKELIDELF